MENLEDVIRAITTEMQKSISAKTVVGDPVTFEGKTIIPLISVGMGFGAGTGTGKTSDGNGGGGAGGGMAIKPIAVVVVDETGVKLETLKSPPKPSVVEQLVEAVPKIAEGMSSKKKETQVPIQGREEA
ncbi:MAG: GerW family sporulation protein [Methanotrichaceae archaeon]